MSKPLDELYLEWLYSQVGSVKLRTKSKTYWSLLKILYRKEFLWLIPNDDNRVEDGRDLRYEFLESNHLEGVDPHWLDLGCSFLEMLIGLSRRLSFEAGGRPRDWFWQLMENIRLDYITDALFDSDDMETVDEVLNRVIFRTYRPDGQGGLFPLKNPEEDQRMVELWYQLCAYIMEKS